jgi:hypothetical protein
MHPHIRAQVDAAIASIRDPLKEPAWQDERETVALGRDHVIELTQTGDFIESRWNKVAIPEGPTLDQTPTRIIESGKTR